MINLTNTNTHLQIFKKVHHDGVGRLLHLLPEPRVVEDLPVAPDLVQSEPPQDLYLVTVGGDEEVGNHLPTEVQFHHLESEEVHEPRQEVLSPGPGEVLDVRFIPQLQLPGVDELDDAGQGPLANILDENLALESFLHGSENTGAEHLRSSAEDGSVDPELLGGTANGEVSGLVILHDCLPVARVGPGLQYELAPEQNIGKIVFHVPVVIAM